MISSLLSDELLATSEDSLSCASESERSRLGELTATDCGRGFLLFTDAKMVCKDLTTGSGS